MTIREFVKSRQLFRTLLYSTWLLLVVLLSYLIQFVIDSSKRDISLVDLFTIYPDLMILLLVAVPTAIPVTYVLQRLFRVSRWGAIIVGIFVIPAAIYAALIGGLFGPSGEFFYVQLISFLPALIAWGFIANTRRNR